MAPRPLRIVKRWLVHQLRWATLPVTQLLMRPYGKEIELLRAYSGLVRQAYQAELFQPWLSTDVFWKGAWHEAAALPPTKSPAQRERDNAVHHYGHDVLLKRHARLPLVGRPLPFLLEHGVNFSDQSSFEVPKSWVRSYFCMGERRAALLRQKYGVRACAIGPYIRYAQLPVAAERLDALKQHLGKTLLVVPAHSTAQVRRLWSQEEWIDRVEHYRRDHDYKHVLWMGFWKDGLPHHGLPAGWIPACNGHASNPWFLDCQRLLFALSDAVCTFALGTHVGYALELGLPLLFARQPLQQDTSQTDPLWRQRFEGELQERERLVDRLLADGEGGPLTRLNPRSAMDLLEPWFGFSQRVSAQAMATWLQGGEGHRPGGPGGEAERRSALDG
jgi:hypothetical protein